MLVLNKKFFKIKMTDYSFKPVNYDKPFIKKK